jgi:hypothetical protein
MTLGNMRRLGVQRLIASCLNDACRHTALIDVSSYPAETEVPYFRSKVVCAKCGGRGNKIDVRPNWKEQPTQPSLTGKQWAVTAHSDLCGVSQSVTDTGHASPSGLGK